MENFKTELQEAFSTALVAIGEGREAMDVIPNVNQKVTDVFEAIEASKNEPNEKISSLEQKNTELEGVVNELNEKLTASENAIEKANKELEAKATELAEANEKATADILAVTNDLEGIKAENEKLLKGFEKKPKETVAKVKDGKITGNSDAGSYASYQEKLQANMPSEN